MNLAKARATAKALTALSGELGPLLDEIEGAEQLPQQRDAAQAALKTAQDGYAAIQAKIAADRQALEDDIAKWGKRRNEEATEHYAKLDAYRAKVEGDIANTQDAMQRRLQQLKAEIDTMTTEHNALTVEGDRLRAQVESLRTRLAAIKSSLPD